MSLAEPQSPCVEVVSKTQGQRPERAAGCVRDGTTMVELNMPNDLAARLAAEGNYLSMSLGEIVVRLLMTHVRSEDSKARSRSGNTASSAKYSRSAERANPYPGA